MRGFFVLGLWAVVILLGFCSGYPLQASLRFAFHCYPAAVGLCNIPQHINQCYVVLNITIFVTLHLRIGFVPFMFIFNYKSDKRNANINVSCNFIMTRKQIILIVFIFLALLAFIVPFIFQAKSESVNQTINLGATIIGTIASILTFLIAFLLYNKFGIDGVLVSNRAEVVFTLLKKVNDSIFFVEHLGGSSFAVGLGNSEKKNLENHYSTKLSFSVSYIDELESLFEIANSPFMPKEIVAKMEKFRYPILSYDIPEDAKIEYAKIYKFKHRNEQDNFGRLNQKDSTLFDFLVYYYDIKDAITAWLAKNTSINIKDLNI